MPKESSNPFKDFSAGLDEVGMGSWAGPLCVAVVSFNPKSDPISGVMDSKKLTHKKRLALAPIIMKEAAFCGIGWAHPSTIDHYGLAEAWRRACLDALARAPGFHDLYIDGVRLIDGYDRNQYAIPHGDATVYSIAAASIVAKVARDMDMIGASSNYPGYGFERNKGYGSREHADALVVKGPSGYHRGSFLRKLEAARGEEMKGKEWDVWREKWAGILMPEEELPLDDATYPTHSPQLEQRHPAQ